MLHAELEPTITEARAIADFWHVPLERFVHAWINSRFVREAREADAARELQAQAPVTAAKPDTP